MTSTPTPQTPDRTTNAAAGPLSRRLVGSSLIVFGALTAFTLTLELLPTADETTGAYLAARSLRVLMMLLASLSFTALYIRNARHAGGLMMSGYLLLFLAFTTLFALEFLFAYFVPFIAQEAPDLLARLEAGTVEPPATMIAAFIAVDLFQLVGAALFFAAALRARVLARAPTVACMSSLLVLSVSDYFHTYVHVASGVAFGLSIVWLGASVANATSVRAVVPRGSAQAGLEPKVET